MEKIFAALGHSTRLWIVVYLAANGPMRQVDLLKALGQSSVTAGEMSAGSLTHLMRPLFDAGLVARDRPRGPLRLVHDEQTRRLLATASALAVAATSESSTEAQRRHAALMRAISSAVESRAEPG